MSNEQKRKFHDEDNDNVIQTPPETLSSSPSTNQIPNISSVQFQANLKSDTTDEESVHSDDYYDEGDGTYEDEEESAREKEILRENLAELVKTHGPKQSESVQSVVNLVNKREIGDWCNWYNFTSEQTEEVVSLAGLNDEFYYEIIWMLEELPEGLNSFNTPEDEFRLRVMMMRMKHENYLLSIKDHLNGGESTFANYTDDKFREGIALSTYNYESNQEYVLQLLIKKYPDEKRRVIIQGEC